MAQLQCCARRRHRAPWPVCPEPHGVRSPDAGITLLAHRPQRRLVYRLVIDVPVEFGRHNDLLRCELADERAELAGQVDYSIEERVLLVAEEMDLASPDAEDSARFPGFASSQFGETVGRDDRRRVRVPAVGDDCDVYRGPCRALASDERATTDRLVVGMRRDDEATPRRGGGGVLCAVLQNSPAPQGANAGLSGP